MLQYRDAGHYIETLILEVELFGSTHSIVDLRTIKSVHVVLDEELDVGAQRVDRCDVVAAKRRPVAKGNHATANIKHPQRGAASVGLDLPECFGSKAIFELADS